MKIKVVNLRKNRSVQGYRCDRTSVLGNPFHMFAEPERDAVVSAFREYLHEVANKGASPVEVVPGLAQKYNVMQSGAWQSPSRDQVMTDLAKLEAMSEVRLLCWCAPLACHCDVIKAYLEWQQPESVQLGLS